MSIIKASFKRPAARTSVSFRANAKLIAPVVRFLQTTDPLGAEWLLMRDTKEASLLYLAFDQSGELTAAAEAVLETEFKGQGSRFLSVWNGELEKSRGASLSFMFNDDDWPAWSLEMTYPGQDFNRLGGLAGVQALVSIVAVDLQPSYVNIARHQYFEKQVFQDHPGVGWMLYLPRVLTVQQVPEARALVPVMGKNEKGKDMQLGTIIVSVTDEPFSDENPEHVKIANAIEIRLVDQDLLPRFADL